MRLTRSLWMIPLLFAAVSAAAADIEPSATRILMSGQSRIYRTYGWAMDPEMFAPISQELQKQGLVSQWKPGQDQVTLGWNGAVYHWRVVRSLDAVRVDGARIKDLSQVEALEMGRELFLPVRATLALMGGTVMWDAPRRTLLLGFAAGGAAGRVTPAPSLSESRRTAAVNQIPTGATAVITGLRWSEDGGGLAFDVEATAPVSAQTLRLENPSRLVIDFSPATFGLNAPLEPRGAVRSIRTGQFQPTVARLVLDLSGAKLAASVPTVAQSQFSIRLAGAGAVPQPVAVVPRTSGMRKVATSKRGSLAVRGGLFQGRDVEKFRELLAQGEIMLRGKVICIDAGHGGHSSGARGVTADVWEKNLCLQMAIEAARALRDAGATVLLTRADDTYLSLDERIDLANERKVDLFISIHCNAMPRANTMTGTETYYCTPQSLDLARAMHSGMVGAMGGRDGGIRRRGFAVIRRTTMPSVLLEVGYINADGDEQKLLDTNYQHSVGEAIRDGVIRYFAG
jgi:N-acetylmuramoyl-L-alanine amidase